MISVKVKGDFRKLDKFFERMASAVKLGKLDRFGRDGVAALQSVTPVDTGNTRDSWSYRIVHQPGRVKIQFLNSNIQNGVPIAIVLQMGHGTGTGGWVEGKDYINPAIRPVFDQILDFAWKEVTG
jgi:hypothetical protein